MTQSCLSDSQILALCLISGMENGRLDGQHVVFANEFLYIFYFALSVMNLINPTSKADVCGA